MNQEDMLDKVIEKCKKLLEIYPDSISLITSLEDYQDLKNSYTQRKPVTKLKGSKKKKSAVKTS